MKFRKTLILICCLFILGQQESNSSWAKVISSDPNSINDKGVILGDVLLLDGNACGSSQKALRNTSKLQLFQGGKWISVGSVTSKKASSGCSSKQPYEVNFKWEVDRLGDLNADGQSGTLRLRTIIVGLQTNYFSVTAFQDEQAEIGEAIQNLHCMSSNTGVWVPREGKCSNS